MSSMWAWFVRGVVSQINTWQSLVLFSFITFVWVYTLLDHGQDVNCKKLSCSFLFCLNSSFLKGACGRSSRSFLAKPLSWERPSVSLQGNPERACCCRQGSYCTILYLQRWNEVILHVNYCRYTAVSVFFSWPLPPNLYSILSSFSACPSFSSALPRMSHSLMTLSLQLSLI